MVGKRLGLGLLTLFAVSVLIFSVVELLPGDLAQEILGQSATPETVAAFRRELGLDMPPLDRFLEWASGVMRGDFGNSLANGRPVADLVAGRLGNTLFLAGYAALIAVPLSLALGAAAARWRDTWFDRTANIGALSAISLPEFFVSYLLVLAFSVTWNIFPSLSAITPDSGLAERLYKAFLPATALTLVVTAHMMRMTRAAIVNLLASPYIETARLKGLAPSRVILMHALPNAIAPIVNVIAVNLAYLVAGVVVVEAVFVYPGLGQLMVDSVAKRDIPVVQAASLMFAATYILLNLLADIIAIASNPRLLHPR